MKIGIGIVIFFVFVYWGVPFFFKAMKKHDYDTMYYGIQSAKANAGASSDITKNKKRMSYGERYARGLLDN